MKRNFISIIILLFFLLPLYPDILKSYRKIKGTQLERKFIQLSRNAIKMYLKEKKLVEPSFELDSSWPGISAGIFITLVKNNRVRGCVGSFFPRQSGFLEEIIHTSVEATYKDSRFDPVSISELHEIKIIITVVGEQEVVDDPYSVNLMEYGLLIKKGNRSAILLPGEARTSEWGINQILKKSGIRSLNNAEYIMFKTITFDERRLKNEENN